MSIGMADLVSSLLCFFFFSSRRRHTRFDCDWSSDVCSSDLSVLLPLPWPARGPRIEAATADLQTAGRSRDAARASARQGLRVAWFALAAAEDRAQAAGDREGRARRNSEAIAALLAEGRVPPRDQARAGAVAA